MKPFVRTLLSLVCLGLLLGWVGTLYAQRIPPPPDPPRLVNDFAGVLSPEERESLERTLVALDDSTSNQVVIMTIRTLDGYPIEEFALQVLRGWGIGNRETNNGVLLLAVIDDREIRIETGYGLEGAIPDITASRIIRNDIVPAFREGNYYAGFERAVHSIIQAAAGEYQAPEGYRDREGKGSPIVFIILIIILIFLFASRNRGGGGGDFMSRRGFGPVFFPGGGFGGSGRGIGGGGFGGGGFGGFGGGMGGGGGASGRW